MNIGSISIIFVCLIDLLRNCFVSWKNDMHWLNMSKQLLPQYTLSESIIVEAVEAHLEAFLPTVTVIHPAILPEHIGESISGGATMCPENDTRPDGDGIVVRWGKKEGADRLQGNLLKCIDVKAEDEDGDYNHGCAKIRLHRLVTCKNMVFEYNFTWLDCKLQSEQRAARKKRKTPTRKI